MVGVTGEYYVCAELGKKGILALLTPKNNPLFDIVAIPNPLHMRDKHRHLLITDDIADKTSAEHL